MVTERDAAERVLDALGDPTRRRIVEILRAGATPVGAVAERLPVSRPAVSKHLRILEAAGLVRYRVAGREHRYELDVRGLAALRTYLDLMWDTALARFAAAAEEEQP